MQHIQAGERLHATYRGVTQHIGGQEGGVTTTIDPDGSIMETKTSGEKTTITTTTATGSATATTFTANATDPKASTSTDRTTLDKHSRITYGSDIKHTIRMANGMLMTLRPGDRIKKTATKNGRTTVTETTFPDTRSAVITERAATASSDSYHLYRGETRRAVGKDSPILTVLHPGGTIHSTETVVNKTTVFKTTSRPDGTMDVTERETITNQDGTTDITDSAWESEGPILRLVRRNKSHGPTADAPATATPGADPQA